MFNNHNQRFSQKKGDSSVGCKRLTTALVLLLLLRGAVSFAQTAATVTVSGTQAGVSTRYMGIQGNGRETFTAATDLGINTWRYFMGMDNFEPVDDKPGEGFPTTNQLKAASINEILNTNNLINWDAYEAILAADRGDNQTHNLRFQYFKDNGIRVMANIRPQHKGSPAWAPDFAPPTVSQADRDEWWQFVYAMVLLFNKKHDYRVDDWELGNEPNLASEGFDGNLDTYYLLVNIARDAIAEAYSRHLGNRTHRVYAPATAWDDATWIPSVIQTVGDKFDHVSYHKYTSYDGLVQSTKNVNGWAGTNREVWLTEWGTWWTDFTTARNSDLPINIQWLKFIMSMSKPGDTYVDGWHYYKLSHSGYGGGDGLLDQRVTPARKEKMYYGLRMGIRALSGGKPVFLSTASNTDLSALTARNADGTYNVIVTNTSSTTSYNVELNLSALATSKANGTLYRFDANNNDAQSQGPALSSTGRATVSVPANGAFLYVTSSTAGNVTAAFQQSTATNGLVSMEAENYTSKADRSSHAWTAKDDILDDSGTGAMQATPDNGTNITASIAATSPELRYSVNFTKTGTHYIWLRGYTTVGENNSVHTGLDGAVPGTADNIETNTFNTWVWIKDTRDGVRASLNVATTGLHTFSVYMREDGFIVDKIVLTTDASYVPSGTGPAESTKATSARLAYEQAGAEAVESLRVFPVPASDQLTLTYRAAGQGNVAISLADARAGARLSLVKPVARGENYIRVNVAALPGGLYLLRLRDGNKVQTRKVIISR